MSRFLLDPVYLSASLPACLPNLVMYQDSKYGKPTFCSGQTGGVDVRKGLHYTYTLHTKYLVWSISTRNPKIQYRANNSTATPGYCSASFIAPFTFVGVLSYI